ncbi:MAG TPA: hypothetical protein VHR66_29895 [Gemmataceae bacterium]|jgi:hypothetical protein|nr:hypothetical protein [Gemmataceae bacterium]
MEENKKPWIVLSLPLVIWARWALDDMPKRVPQGFQSAKRLLEMISLNWDEAHDDLEKKFGPDGYDLNRVSMFDGFMELDYDAKAAIAEASTADPLMADTPC